MTSIRRFGIFCFFLTAVCTSIAGRLEAQSALTPSTAGKQQGGFDSHDLSGVWWVSDPGPDRLLDRAKNGDASKCTTCHISEHTVPEPPLTAWAKENLLFEGLFSMGPASNSGTKHTQAKRDPCSPIGVPEQLWYTQLFPFEFAVAKDRIYQFFEKYHEYRVIWMNRDHPRNLKPTYMGDSVGRWDGDTLVVDTIGYNGKEFIEVGVDHLMSTSFHLVERYSRTSFNALEDDVTYYDPKVWGDRPWGGLKKEFVLQPGMELEEYYCNREDIDRFAGAFIKPAVVGPR